MPRPFVHDQYAPLSHKASLGDGTRLPTVASWVPADDVRRLAAYRVLAAYVDNVARFYLPDGFTDAQRDKYREYGHAGVLVLQTRATLLGRRQTIDIPDAHDDTAPPAEGESPPAPTVAQLALDWLVEWATRERLKLRMLEAEHDAVSLGDGIYTLQWDTDLARPTIEVWDPGFYFPVLDGGVFPRRIHMAWEEQPSLDRTELHRVTWSLDRIRPALNPDPFGDSRYLYDEQGRPVPQDGDKYDPATGLLTRRYAWQGPDEKPSTVTCHLTHAIWDLSKVRGSVYDLDPSVATYLTRADGRELRDLDLKLDFIPLVHVPNDAAGKRHFGKSSLMLPAQVLDDLAGADSDLAENSALVGSTPLVTKGVKGGDIQAGPGARIQAEAGGSAEFLDTSRALDALLKYDDHLEDRLAKTSRMAKALLGGVNPEQVPSGYAVELSFTPTDSLVDELRAVRDEKYPLLLRFALRMAQANKQLAAGPTPNARLLFGAYRPADVAGVVKMVTDLLAGDTPAISIETAVRILQQKAELPIDDAREEVARIQHENFKKAGELLDALGDEAAVAAYLGRDLPTPGAGE